MTFGMNLGVADPKYRPARRVWKLTESQRRILQLVADSYGIPAEWLRQSHGPRTASTARHMAFYLLHDVFGMSLPTIGQAMGGFHHTAVLHGVRRVRNAVERDPGRAERFVEAARKVAGERAIGAADIPEAKVRIA